MKYKNFRVGNFRKLMDRREIYYQKEFAFLNYKIYQKRIIICDSSRSHLVTIQLYVTASRA